MEKVIDTDLISLIDKDEFAGYGVGIHSIGEDRGVSSQVRSKDEIARSIMEEGLKLGDGYGSINGNVIAIGILQENNERIDRLLKNWKWGNGKQTNVLVLYPPIVQNSNGERLYLGYTKDPGGFDQDTSRSCMDIACCKLGYVPKEFILGYYADTEKKYEKITRDEHITYDFEQNPNFCGSYKISDELYNKLSHALRNYKDLSVECAKAIDTKDISKVEERILQEKKMCNLFGLEKQVKMLECIFEDVQARIERKLQQDKSKKIDVLDTNLLDLLSDCEGYSIALHGIRPEEKVEGMTNTEVAQDIFQNGIKYNEYYSSINGVTRGIGIKGDDDQQIARFLQNYKIVGETQTNTIIAYPPIIENSKGEKLYLGHTDSKEGKDTPTSFMDYICHRFKSVPKEFILGYYVDTEKKYGEITRDEHITYEFIKNPNYCHGSKVDDKLFGLIAEQLGDFKTISEECVKSLESGDVSKLFNLMLSKLGLHKAMNDEKSSNLLLKIYNEIRAQIPTQQLTSNGIKKVARDGAVILENSNAQSVINECQYEKNNNLNNKMRGE